MNSLSEEEYVLDLIERLKPCLPMMVSPGKSLIANYRLIRMISQVSNSKRTIN